MTRVGCTGGVGSGKSTVCALLAARGAEVLDVDAMARVVSARNGPAFEPILRTFGQDIIGRDGELDRHRIAQLVFADPDLRHRLETLIHPFVEAEICSQLRKRDSSHVLILDHPLLVETNARERFALDAVLVVDVPEEIVIERLATQRNWTQAEVRARIAAQCSREQRRSAADFIILNIGSVEELELMVDRAWVWMRSLLEN